MSALISLENVSVRFPIAPDPPKKKEGDSRSMLWQLAYRPRSAKNRSLVLKHIWLTIGEGERLAIIGPNGSGKSTLLRVMSGTIPHHTGRITQQGKMAAILSVSAGFQPAATGYENIFLRGLVLGLTRKEIEQRIPEIVEFTDLGDWLYQPVSTYSSGMTLRLAFAISTCVTPDVIIMDEWIGAGDNRFLAAASKRLRAMVTTSRILVLASHNEKVVREFCTNAIVLYKGQIVFRGPVDEAFRFYNEFNSLPHVRQ